MSHLPLSDRWWYGLIGAMIVLILTPATLTGTAARACQDQRGFLDGVDRVMAERHWQRKTTAVAVTLYRPPAFVAPFVDGLTVDLSAPGVVTLAGPAQFLNRLKNIP